MGDEDAKQPIKKTEVLSKQVEKSKAESSSDDSDSSEEEEPKGKVPQKTVPVEKKAPHPQTIPILRTMKNLSLQLLIRLYLKNLPKSHLPKIPILLMRKRLNQQ